MITIDFETMPIVGNPVMNPPDPIGVSIKKGDGSSIYLTDQHMEEGVREAYESGDDLLFHNAPFDLSVAERWLGLEWPSWERIHDTMYSVYLWDPHARSMSLKDSAKRIIGWCPAARDELKEWLLENVKEASERNWGRFIYKAPPWMVATYAGEDTDMTYALHKQLYVPSEAYDVERELMPYLVKATRKGIRVDRDRLQVDAGHAMEAIKEADNRIIDLLGGEPFDVANGNQLAAALDVAGKIKEDDWVYTKTGRRSTARDNLVAGIRDKELLNLLIYVGAMRTCLGTFMLPWLEKSELDGRLHPNWNQIKTTHGKKKKGTRTGRLSSDDPNLQNVPNPFDYPVPMGLMDIPNMRDYLLPEVGQVWVSRDYDAQEMRILAHYSKDAMTDLFNADPNMDPHTMVQGLIKEQTGLNVTRKHCKGTGFGLIYGMGATGLALQMGIDPGMASKLMAAYLAAVPGVAVLQHKTRRIGQKKMSLSTLGGRKYTCEEPCVVDGQMRSLEYKLLNYLIQGGAADQMKRALLLYFREKPEGETFLCTVHDEVNCSMTIDDSASEYLNGCMVNAIPDMRVPFTTDLSVGTHWGALK